MSSLFIEPKKKRLELYDYDKGDVDREIKPKRGKEIDDRIVGRTFLHASSRVLYVTIGITRDAERDRWMVRYREYDLNSNSLVGVEFTHLPEDFEKEGRFVEVAGRARPE